uniref:VWFA domain-containing protein n=1 Tax=Panagrolaimus superbus TaxID=310955 RepID=A0A914XR07_9BILA
MFVKLPIITAILAFIILYTKAAEESENSIKCDKSPLQAVFLFDISPTNSTYFSIQQQRVIETIKHIDVLTQERSISFGFVVFHRLPVLLSPLNSPKSSDSSKVKEQVENVRPRRHAEASPAKALDLAAEQIEKNGREGARSVVFLVHDGLSSDLIAETLEAVDRLREQNVEVFAITGSPNPNLLALSGYTHERNRIYASEADRFDFFESIDQIVGSCENAEKSSLPKLSTSLDSSPLKIKEASPFFKFDDTVTCSEKNENVDLMIVLDTSGSVYNAFEAERKLAENLIQNLNPIKFEKNMQNRI